MNLKAHELKTWPEYFEAILDGRKRFEIRKNDRGFEVGDHLILMEYDPTESKYSDREIYCEVDYIMHGKKFGLILGYCIMNIVVKNLRGC